ncbi:hypothetical protein PVAG01_06477 [Phlyctema vagabunda]|uniref:Uncharacterized protein n=1 Tax=Phlyctema vagabunda TaxID=108571 RepID=A0ABR4PG52_9HELO
MTMPRTVKRQAELLERAERTLRASEPGGVQLSGNELFERHRGDSRSLYEFLYAKRDHAYAFVNIKSVDAVSAALDQTLGLLHLVQSDIFLQDLQNSFAMGTKTPQEILDHIRVELVSAAVARRRDIMHDAVQRQLAIAMLRKQILQMYAAAEFLNVKFWVRLLGPGPGPGENLDMFSYNYKFPSDEHMEAVLESSYLSWSECPRAMDVIKRISEGQWRAQELLTY